MIRRSFRKFSKSAFIPLSGAPVRPHVEHDMQTFLPSLKEDANHFKRIKSLYSRLEIGLRHVTYEERLQRMGLHSLPWRRVLANLIIAFKISTDHLDVDRNRLFHPHTLTMKCTAPVIAGGEDWPFLLVCSNTGIHFLRQL